MTIIRKNDGNIFCGRRAEALNNPYRDNNYGHVDLPPYESEVFADLILGGKAISEDQLALLQNLALPLFRENSDGDTASGEEWKQ